MKYDYNKLIKWQNEHWREDTIICPWCNYIFENNECIYEETDEEIECPCCRSTIEVETEITGWRWITRKPERLYEEASNE